MVDPYQYIWASRFFIHFLGLLYFFVFGAFIFQIKALLGKDGILPIGNFLEYGRMRFGNKRYYYLPTVFWMNHSDAALLGVVWAGTVVSLLLFFNVYPPLMLFLLYLLYISVVTIGQDFLSFGWDIFILEITLNAFFLSLTPVPNVIIWISINFLLFRFHIQAGVVKLLSRDPNWLNLTALKYHYETQPLPNTIAWFVYKLPMWFHKFSTLLMFIIELIVPFAIFGNAEIRLFVFICFVGLQYFIWLTGNFSYLNHMTVVLCLILVADGYWSIFLRPPIVEETSIWLDGFVTIAGSTLLFYQVVCLWNHFMPNRTFMTILSYVYPFHIANRYGIFAVMTTKRYEIVVEGSNDGIEWKEYIFKYKPSELNHRPRRISPYQPRLDWQVWFLPFTHYEEEAWFQNFLFRLLQGSPLVLSLLEKNPFPDAPPKYIRSLAYDYTFTDWKTLREKGDWWKRELVGSYSPTIALREPTL